MLWSWVHPKLSWIEFLQFLSPSNIFGLCDTGIYQDVVEDSVLIDPNFSQTYSYHLTVSKVLSKVSLKLNQMFQSYGHDVGELLCT